MKVVFAEPALNDISRIYDRISMRSVLAARRVENKIKANCERLGDFPFVGAKTNKPNVFRLPVVKVPYTIFYRVDQGHDLVEIARVVHSRRVRNLRRVPKG